MHPVKATEGGCFYDGLNVFLFVILLNLGIFEKCTIFDILSDKISEPGSDLRVSKS